MNDQQLFDKIDELIKDENKIVTFKDLSEQFDIHVNHAKRVLEEYLKVERENVRACYIVTGLFHNEGNAEHLTRIVIVPERHLETIKSASNEITSCHVYSVQRFEVKDGGTIYMNEAVNRQTLPRKCRTAIKNDNIVIINKKKSNKTLVKNEPTTNSVPDKKTVASPKKKPNPLASAFAKTAPTAAAKKETETKAPTNKNVGKKGKKPTKSSNALLSYMNKGSSNVKVEKAVQPPVKVEEPPVKESMWSSSDDGSDEEVRQPKKRQRRRIKEMSDDSEEEIQQPEPPVPASPAKESSEGSGMDEDPIPPTPPEPRMRSQYKLVTRTYQDEDGFIVTKKEKEIVEEEMSEDPLPPPPPKKKVDNISPENVAAKKKQSSLTSFFKKK